MKRVEIIGNQELMADLEEKIWAKLPHHHYTILPVLTGKGRKGLARGDSVWPTINFYCILFVEMEADVKVIQDIVKIIKHDNTVNALKATISEGNISWLLDYKPQISAIAKSEDPSAINDIDSNLLSTKKDAGTAASDGEI